MLNLNGPLGRRDFLEKGSLALGSLLSCLAGCSGDSSPTAPSIPSGTNNSNPSNNQSNKTNTQPTTPITPTTPIVTSEQKELTTASSGLLTFYSDFEKRNVNVGLVDEFNNRIPTVADINYYSNLEQVVITSFPKQDYLPSLYIEDRSGSNLAGILDGVFRLVTSKLSNTRYGNISAKLFKDLPNLFQNKTIIPGLLVKKGDWSFNDIKNANYWANRTSIMMVPLSGGFTAPIAAATSVSGRFLDGLDSFMDLIDDVSGKKINRDQKVAWYELPLLNISVPNLIPFLADSETPKELEVPSYHNNAKLTFVFPVNTADRWRYKGTWQEWSVNLIFDSGCDSITRYMYLEDNQEYIGFTAVEFGSDSRANEFNQQYLGKSFENMRDIYNKEVFYFPNDSGLDGVYFYEAFDGLDNVFFFPVNNYWIGMDVDLRLPNNIAVGTSFVKRLRELNP